MGKSSGGKIPVAEYRMSIHLGICSGPVDHISAIFAGEEPAWEGYLAETGVININKEDMFGGLEKEGGLVGAVTFLSGYDDQIMPEYLAAKAGKTSDTAVAYRGTASVYFTEQINVEATLLGSEAGSVVSAWNWLSTAFSSAADGAWKGFYFVANNPYLRSLWVKVGRAPVGLDSRYAKLWRNEEGEYVDEQTAEFDANPAGIIYECLTDREWGMGSPLSSIDAASFENAAKALYDEKFGLSLTWTRSTSIESFVSEIIDHIEAAVFINPGTGLLTLKLIRFDYDPEDLFVANNDNSVITNFARKHWGETINEIVVTWTNPLNEKEETVTAQDLANIAVQGAVVSAGRNYHGIRSARLAQFVAERDLRAASYPLASCDIEILRTDYRPLPGDVVKIVSPEDNVTSLLMRVGPVEYGRPGRGAVRATIVEDVFALGTSQFSIPPTTDHSGGAENPQPAAFEYVFTLPFYAISNMIGEDAAAAIPYPTVYAGVLAGQPGSDTAAFVLDGAVVDAVGTVSSQSLGTFIISSHATLLADITTEAVTVIPAFAGVTQGEGPSVGGFVIIGDSDLPESVVELAVVQSIDGDGYHLRRGVLDTIPRAWDVGTEVWFVSEKFTDTEARSVAEEVDYRIRPRTSRGTLRLGDAPLTELTMSDRSHLPTRPANVRFNGTLFSDEIDATPAADVVVTWATRNRLTETAQVLSWTSSGVTPEAGQTTTIEVWSENQITLYTTISGIVGGTYSLPFSAFDGKPYGVVIVYSERDGFRSLQGRAQRVHVPAGYGYSYGYNYGGA